MTERPLSVLFMDDQISDNTALVVSEAVKALEEKGWNVTTTDRMSESIDAFYHKFYDVFVLDIDMAKVKDIIEGRGSKVAQVYRALDNGCAVIMYSAAGTVEDWFYLANCHVYGYVFKNEHNAVNKLVTMVERAARELQADLTLPEPRQQGPVLLVNETGGALDTELLIQSVKQAGEFEPVCCALSDVAEHIGQDDPAAVVVLADTFDTRPTTVACIDRICATQPRPHVILGCRGRDENRASILNLLNARPLRLININSVDVPGQVTEAIKAAARWYGGREVIKADLEYVHRAGKDIDWDALDQAFNVDEYDTEMELDEEDVWDLPEKTDVGCDTPNDEEVR